MTLVDFNVLIDLLTIDSVWYAWSSAKLDQRAVSGALMINEVIYAELSAGMESYAELDEALMSFDVELARIPKEALFMAGKAFQRYRAAGGTRTALPPDFFIGAHARVAQWPILTRDVRRYRSYFPDVALIAPDR